LPDYQLEIDSLQKTDINILTLEDYSNLKNINKESERMRKKTSPVKSEVEQLLKDVEELEQKFPEQIKLKYRQG
jgi:hypothetical protein